MNAITRTLVVSLVFQIGGALGAYAQESPEENWVYEYACTVARQHIQDYEAGKRECVYDLCEWIKTYELTATDIPCSPALLREVEREARKIVLAYAKRVWPKVQKKTVSVDEAEDFLALIKEYKVAPVVFNATEELVEECTEVIFITEIKRLIQRYRNGERGDVWRIQELIKRYDISNERIGVSEATLARIFEEDDSSYEIHRTTVRLD